MTNEQLFPKFRSARSPEDMMTIAKENGIEMTEEAAKHYFETYFSKNELADDELDHVSGGGCKDNEAKPITPKSEQSCFVCAYCYESYNGRYTHHCSHFDTYLANNCTACIFYRDMVDGVRGHYCKK